jgi:hypothetical protein
MQLLFRKTNSTIFIDMEYYKLIEKKFADNPQDLPAIYKILKSSVINKSAANNSELSIFTTSERHQTTQFEAKRFYKNITIFKI